MLIIWGIRRRVAAAAMIRLACRNGHVAAHRLLKVTTWFTLFFIPLIPFGRKYSSVCTYCGLQLQVPKPEAEQLLARVKEEAAAAGTAAAVDPVAPPIALTGTGPAGAVGAGPVGAGPVGAGPAGAGVAASVPVAAGGLPPAGWYPDPAGSPGRRYWDGQQWTANVESV